jgi:Uma2 family endonuclease
MSTQPKTFLTPEEYLEYERQSDVKHEYFKGEMFAMAGGSSWHGVIINNVGGELRQRLREKPCVVCVSDVRLKVTATGLYTYPDIMVLCGDIQHADDRKDTVLNPILIVEVLSPSTRDYDRGQKFQHYRTLPSLHEYLTVAQEVPHVEHWIRQAEHRGSFAEYDNLNEIVRLASLGIDLPLAEIYLKIGFTPGS